MRYCNRLPLISATYLPDSSIKSWILLRFLVVESEQKGGRMRKFLQRILDRYMDTTIAIAEYQNRLHEIDLATKL